MASYTVKAGDTLSGIAQKMLGSSSKWNQLGYAGDPRNLQVGTVLKWGGSTPVRAAAAPKPAGQVDLMSAVNKQTADFEKLLNRQKGEQEGLFKNYETIRGGQERLPALYSRLENELGIPELSGDMQIFKDQIYSVRDLIDRLDEDVNTRTTGTFTTDEQRRRQIAAEGEPLRNQLGRLGTGMEPLVDRINSATGQLGTMMNLNVQQQERDLEPVKMRIEAISDRFAREITGFTSNKQNELTALMDKLQRQRQLSDRDWELAQQLASEERAFDREKQLIGMRARAEAAANPGLQWGYNQPGSSNIPTPQAPRNLPSMNRTVSLGSPSSSSRILMPTYNPQAVRSGASLQGGGGYNLQGAGALNALSLRVR